MNNPILSIVIANYNYGRFLETAIESVVSQGVLGKVELIVVDGGSSDNSVEIIKKFADKIAWWVSEKDEGQSDAFNKGFAHSHGKYLTWLNADDFMPQGCLARVVRSLESHSECEWFTANFCRILDDGSVVEIGWGPHWLPKWLQTRQQPLAVYGPSTFFSKKLFDRLGGMKVYQNFMMDTDLWMRFIVAGVKQRRINCICWVFRMHADSKTAEFGDHKLSPDQRARFEAERKRAISETGYKPSNVNRRLIQLWRILDGSILKCLLLHSTFKRIEI